MLPPAVVEGDAAAKPKKPLYGKKKPPAKKPTADAEEKSSKKGVCDSKGRASLASPEAPEAAKVESAETPPEEAAAMDTAAEAEDEVPPMFALIPR